MASATATLERTSATPEDFPADMLIPRDVPIAILELPRGLGFTKDDFGFGDVSPSNAVAASEDDEDCADIIDRARYCFLEAMRKLDVVEEWDYNEKGQKIKGSVRRRSRWECKKLRIQNGSPMAYDALQDHWIQFVDLNWEEVLPELVFVDPRHFNGKDGRMTIKEWREERHDNPVIKKRQSWMKSTMAEYARKAKITKQVEEIKAESAMPDTYEEIEDLHIGQLKKLCAEAGLGGAGKKEHLVSKLAEYLSLEADITT